MSDLDATKREIMRWQGVVGLGENGDGLTVFVLDESVTIPSMHNGVKLTKHITGRIVAR